MINGKGWALVLRADGNKTTFGYDSTHWTTGSTLNLDGYATGIMDATMEYKSPLFNAYPYSELRLGMRINGTTNWLEIKHGHTSSMLAAMTGGQIVFSGTTRKDWLALAHNGALQPNCDRRGYFLGPGNSRTVYLRIGIVGNDQNDCDSPDSFVGFGSKRM
jgi:hypothetical protein